MKTQTRTSQGGSVVSFLVIGVVLVVITLGAIYFAQQRGQHAGQPTVSPSPSPSAQPSSSPSASPNPSVSPAPQSSSAAPTPSSAPQTGHMPTTGPADDLLLSALPGAILVGVSIAYLRSRKLRFDSLYR